MKLVSELKKLSFHRWREHILFHPSVRPWVRLTSIPGVVNRGRVNNASSVLRSAWVHRLHRPLWRETLVSIWNQDQLPGSHQGRRGLLLNSLTWPENPCTHWCHILAVRTDPPVLESMGIAATSEVFPNVGCWCFKSRWNDYWTKAEPERDSWKPASV